MKQYLTTKHGWNEKTWGKIDHQIVKAYHNHKKISTRNMWFKVAHNLHPLGERTNKMSSHMMAPQSDIAICPCCQKTPETQLHMFICDPNPNRTAALIELTTGGSTYKEHHHFTQVMTDCIEQWLHNPTGTPSANDVACPTLAPYDTLLPNHMMDTLREAITEQTEIGWENLFRGFISSKWRDMASQHMLNPEATPNKADGNLRSGTIIQRLQGYIQLIWKGRNDALHKCNKDDETKFLSLESAEIRHYFKQPHLLPVQDQHYCQGNVLKILQSRPSIRRRWLMRVRRARAALLKDQLRQSRITSYFNRSPTSGVNNFQHTGDAAQHPCSQSQYQLAPTKTQRAPLRQARLHHYFPGRPPELTEERSAHRPKSSAST
jgi:hypothetical protein